MRIHPVESARKRAGPRDPAADRRKDQLRQEASLMQSPFIGVSDSCSIRHTKRDNLFDVSFFFLKTFRFFFPSPRLFFFFLFLNFFNLFIFIF